MLQVIRSEQNVFPGYNPEGGQAVLNAQIANMEEYALFVGIMWNRVGTPTPRAESGTIEEFERAIAAFERRGQPQIWFYFGEALTPLNMEGELEQRRKVLEFKKKVQRNALTREYQDPSNFRAQFRNHITLWLNELPNKVKVQEDQQLTETFTKVLPTSKTEELSQESLLAQQMRAWFEVLGYEFEEYQHTDGKGFEWIIRIQGRRRYDRILIRGVDGEAGISDAKQLQEVAKEQDVDEAWLVAARRISPAAKKNICERDDDRFRCLTFDELLDDNADFSAYLDWLEQEIQQRKIVEQYVPLACCKDEVDLKTQATLGRSRYGEDEGWIDGYIDRWLDDPSKEHVSVLGEFGTGKTWFTLHYAWRILQKYREAKQQSVARPRLPLIILLRDYAKAIKVDNIIAGFFFTKHNIRLNAEVFDQLNKMGKLLLIFDGFDEMAARVDRQQMINQFWELAEVVKPGAKVILTCRTEHFPEAREGRALLNAELLASTAALNGLPAPQFEVLELEKFNDQQIRQVLSFQAEETTVEKVMGNPLLSDLAKRPVMMELVLEALPDIEAGKPVDMSRVYLYAVRRKMERDIKAERTFTSMADKLYFLCELSWEMLSHDRMSLNYRNFPDQLRQLFGARVQEEKTLDHWHYDMMGQTMLIRDSEGDYSPAHRSLLEFFVAYKLVAMLGIMDEDFVEIAREQTPINTREHSRNYSWDAYFRRTLCSDDKPLPIAGLQTFSSSPMDDLYEVLQKELIAKAVLDLLIPMLTKQSSMKDKLLKLAKETRGKKLTEVGIFNSNLLKILVTAQTNGLENADMSNMAIQMMNFSSISLRGASLKDAILDKVIFNRILGAVYSLAYSPDGAMIAVGDSLGKLRIWNAITGEVIQLLEGHTLRIYSVNFSPKGDIVVSASEDKTIRLWDAQSGMRLNELAKHSKPVLSVVFSPNGKILASGSSDKTIKLWDVQSGTELKTLDTHSKDVNSIVFSPDGKILASGSSDKTIKLWDVQSGTEIQTFNDHADIVRAISFSPDGIFIVSGSNDRTVRIWNIQSGTSIKTSEDHWDCVRTVAFSSDGKLIASGGSDKTVRLWDATTGGLVKTFKGQKAHHNQVLSVVFSPVGSYLASGSSDKTVKLWNTTSGEQLHSLEGHSSMVRSASFSPDGHYIVSGGSDKTVKLWQSDGKLMYTLKGHSDWIRAVAFSKNGNYIASSSDDMTIRVWNTPIGELMGTLKGHAEKVRMIAFSPDERHIVSVSDDRTVKIWDIHTFEVTKTLEEHSDWVRSVSFSVDGQYIASAGNDITVKIWDADSWELIKTLEHSSEILSVAFSTDGNYVAAGSEDNTIRIWDIESSNTLHILNGHSSKVVSVVFSANGQHLVSGSHDKTIKFWDVQSGENLTTLAQHSDWVWSVHFSTDGSKIISASDDQTMRIWDASTGECLQTIEDKLCAGLDITGVQGLSEAQKEVLRGYGAFAS
ncbi:hypothetical protein QT972_20975 [Microcoleus sp. herbarium7]|uniref:WD40 domain-containing protein n=1 Tax=Microcoleus sp. herbarium7 TaxID=3055435 RepID=UPI002FD67A34